MWGGPGGVLISLLPCAVLPLVLKPRRLTAKCGAGFVGLLVGLAIALALAYPFSGSFAPLMPRGVPLLLGVNLPALGAIAGILWFTFWARHVESAGHAQAAKRRFVKATGVLVGAAMLLVGAAITRTLFIRARDSRICRAGAGKLDEVRALVESHPEVVTARNRFGETPLHIAAEGGDRDVAGLLIARGADVNASDSIRGDTPLHYAARHRAVAVAGVLLAHGADVNAPNRKGRTPLHAATVLGARAIAELLLDHGGDVNARDKRGRTALGCALRAGHCGEDVASLLRSRGGVE